MPRYACPSRACTHRIRDLNDEINKCIREKGHWERRIVELGGPDYSRVGPAVTDSKGREVAELTGDFDGPGGSKQMSVYGQVGPGILRFN